MTLAVWELDMIAFLLISCDNMTFVLMALDIIAFLRMIFVLMALDIMAFVCDI
jgi:hypothetical protein